MAEQTTLPLQEAVLTMLCYDPGPGAALAAQVKPEFFDGVYKDFAARVLQYRRRYGKPPGRGQTADLAVRSMAGKDNPVVKRLLPRMSTGYKDVNAEYVLGRAQDFVRRQILKGALINASDRYQTDDEDMVPNVEKILYDALKFRSQTLQRGTFLNDTKLALGFQDINQDIISLGIPQLDALDIGLVPKEMLLYIAPKGSGKTWFCVHCGRQGLLQRKKVCHISLEMSEMKMARRYYQSLFAIARKGERIQRTRFIYDGDADKHWRRLEGFRTRNVTPKLYFTMPRIRRILRRKVRSFGTRLSNLVIKEFPTGQLTLPMLTSYLDYLAEVEDFVPDILQVDYPDLMATSEKNFRIDIGKNFEGLRGIAVDRNMALVAPTQGGRKTIGARRVRSTHVAEDIRKVQAADTVLAFSRTEGEASLGLGRLSVEHARDSEGGAVIVLAQSYETGQYVLDSAQAQNAYWEQLRELGVGEDGNYDT